MQYGFVGGPLDGQVIDAPEGMFDDGDLYAIDGKSRDIVIDEKRELVYRVLEATLQYEDSMTELRRRVVAEGGK